MFPTPSYWPLMTTLEISPTIEASPSAFPGSVNARVFSALRPQRTCPPTFPRTQCRLPRGSDHTFVLHSELMEAPAGGGQRREARPGHRQTGGGPIWIQEMVWLVCSRILSQTRLPPRPPPMPPPLWRNRERDPGNTAVLRDVS